ncbi:MAG TPA: DivIVA domain-containing protein [Gaiellaceae bacterium]
MTEFHRRLARHAGLPYIEEPEPVESALSAAAARRFGVLPILDDGRVLGVVTSDPGRLDVAALAALVDRRVDVAVAAPHAIERGLAALAEAPAPEPEAAAAEHEAPPLASPEPAQAPPPPVDLDFVGMADSPFGRGFRGYRRDEVDAALARHQAEVERLQAALGATEARANAMQVEIRDLHGRLDALRERESAATRALDELRERREQMERDSRMHAQQLVLEAQERATLLKSEGLRQVGELQAQVEQLIGMRAGLTQALQRLSEDLAAAMARLASSPATAIDRPVEHHVERWSHEHRGD